MNNKGFTLIELIMVIAILAMLALLSTPNVISLINKNKVDNYNSTIDSILEAAELYVSNHRYDLNFKDAGGNSVSCTPEDTFDIYTNVVLGDLINSKSLTNPVKNFCTDENIPHDLNIKITLSCKTKNFSYKITGLRELPGEVTDSDGKIIIGKKCTDLY